MKKILDLLFSNPPLGIAQNTVYFNIEANPSPNVLAL